MFIGQMCNRNVVSARRETSIAEAAQIMRKFHVGNVIVVEPVGGGDRPIGIVTDRDMVLEVLAQGLDPAKVTLGDLVTQSLVTIEEHADYMDAIHLMVSRNVRRLPVVSAGGLLAGIVALDDVVRALALPLAELSDLSARGRKRELQQRP